MTGGSPRYQIYRTADDRFLAAAPLEQKFWERFCDLIGLDAALREDARDPEATKRAVAALIRRHGSEHWRARFSGEDTCCTVALTIAEAIEDPHFRARGLFAWSVTSGDARLAAVPVPVAPQFRAAPGAAASPALGEANGMIVAKP